MSMSRPGAASNVTQPLLSSAAGVTSAASSAANDQPLATTHTVGGNGTAVLAVLVAAFAVAVTGVVGAAGIRSSRRRY